jgi:hypothetical protein
MDIAVVLLTAALVVTTAIYSYFTWRMAKEMQETRVQALRPRLGLLVRPYGPTGGFLALRSLGPGTALDVSVTLRFEPSGEARDWRTPVFPPGDEAEFFFPDTESGQAPDFTMLEEHGVVATVTGSVLDVAGKSHQVDERLDVATWAKVLTSAHQRYDTEPADKIATELKKIRETFDKVRRVLERLLSRTPSSG